jgi:hypothetical protein
MLISMNINLTMTKKRQPERERIGRKRAISLLYGSVQAADSIKPGILKAAANLGKLVVPAK